MSSAIKASSWKLTVLQKIRHKFTQKQFLQILTSQFFSKLYYGSQIWLTSATQRNLWTRVNSLHYRALRIAICDFKGRINREKIDVLSSRASPKQWSKYAMAAIVIKTIRDKQPTTLHELIMETMFEERRKPGLAKFYNNSKGKVGRQKIGNNLDFMMAIKQPWTQANLNNDKIRMLLKETYFTYLNNIITN